jgi:hypothetical protein
MKTKILCLVGMVFAIFTLMSEMAVAQPGQSRMFGKGAPFQISDLPQNSRLRKSLEALPATERGRAMDKLHGFSFPQNDAADLQADSEGGIFYSESYLPQPVSGSPSAATAVALSLPPVDALKLHSRLGASRKVFLDFDGHTITGTAWNTGTGRAATYIALPFDVESTANPLFNSDELNRIHEIWHRIADDYAPFDIDVTTEEPDSFGPTVGRILFTKDVDANGIQMPSYGAGGVAYVNVWGASNYASYYSPALVYYNRLGPNHPPSMAEAGSHELGHNLSLSHDGTINGAANLNCPGTTGYYCGQGSGLVSWGPIMGVGYYTNVTEWSKGEYTYANNTQDDLAIISGKLPYRVDDRGNTTATTTQLLVESDGSILNTNPQNDPGNVDPNNKGIVETGNDIDMFYFNAAAGSVSITLTPAWAAFTRSSTRGANLDIQATLYDQFGNQIAANDPNNDTNATISTTVGAGRYYLAVSGVGNAVTPYSDYGSLGEYFISGSVPPAAVIADTAPPTPSPMTWASVPTAQSSSSITMTATTAGDPSGGVQYQFHCTVGGTGCTTSTWQSSSSYLATGLAAATNYSFEVVARDAAGNVTTASMISSTTTQAAVTLPIAPPSLTVTALTGKKIKLQWTDASDNETSFIVQRSTNGGSSWTWSTTLAQNTANNTVMYYTNNGLTAGKTYTYRVGASNSVGTAYSPNASASAIR